MARGYETARMQDQSNLKPQSVRAQEKIGIILMNTGSPKAATPQAVKAYLQEFLMDRHVVDMPPLIWKRILDYKILPKRCETLTKKYERIWRSKDLTAPGSPLVQDLKGLVARTERLILQEPSFADVHIYVRDVMTYGEPRIDWTMQEFRNLQLDQIVVMPLYPQQGISITWACYDACLASAAKFGIADKLRLIADYHKEKAYLSSLSYTAFVRGFDEDQGDKIIFSFHSIPLRHIEEGDVYKQQVEQTCADLAHSMCLKPETWRFAYQSCFGKQKDWLGPTTQDVIAELIEDRPSRIFIMTPGFSLECLETTIEFEDVFIPAFQAALDACGDDAYRPQLMYIDCLGNTDLHARMILSILKKHLHVSSEAPVAASIAIQVAALKCDAKVQDVLDKTDAFPRLD